MARPETLLMNAAKSKVTANHKINSYSCLFLKTSHIWCVFRCLNKYLNKMFEAITQPEMSEHSETCQMQCSATQRANRQGRELCLYRGFRGTDTTLQMSK